MQFFAHDRALALTQPAMNYAKIYFEHEKLIAYERSIEFVAWASQLLEELPAKLAVCDQLDRASTSVPLNIAEGNAKFTPPDRCRYWDTARGSALECAACLDVLVAKGILTVDRTEEGKRLLSEVVSLIIGLCKSVSPDRFGEEPPPYTTGVGVGE